MVSANLSKRTDQHRRELFTEMLRELEAKSDVKTSAAIHGLREIALHDATGRNNQLLEGGRAFLRMLIPRMLVIDVHTPSFCTPRSDA